jgi:hypothetical protein
MKKRILLGFGLLLIIFLAGSIIAVLYITKTTDRMDRLVLLHQVEILHEDHIIRIQQVQSHIFRNRIRMAMTSMCSHPGAEWTGP